MSPVAHTPGPWKITDEWAGRIAATVGNDKEDVAQVTTMANARLIAAAPELYSIVSYVATHKCPHPEDPGACHFCAARSVIRKVTGP